MAAFWMVTSWMTASDPSLCKTPLGETGCLGNPYFTYWLPKHPVFWFTLTLTQSVRLPMVTYPSLCSTWWLTGHYATPEVTTCFPPNPVIPHSSVDYHQVFKPILYFQSGPSQSDLRLYPTPLYLGKQRISLGVTIILSMCLCPPT